MARDNQAASNQSSHALVGLAVILALCYAAWVGLDAGQRTPEFVTSAGVQLSHRDLRRITAFNDIELDQKFFYLIPEFQALEDHQHYLAKHKRLWMALENSDTHIVRISDQAFTVQERLPTKTEVLAKFGAMYAVATLFAIGGLVALWRHRDSAGRAAALFLFGGSLVALALPALVTRGLSIPFELLETTLAIYYLGTCALVGLIFFPFAFNSTDLPKGIAMLVLGFLAVTTSLAAIRYFLGTAAFASSYWFTVVCVFLFAGRIAQRCYNQRFERNITHMALCYLAVALPTFSFSALVSWPELLAVEASSLQYFVLTSTVVPIAMVSLLESELLQQKTVNQATQLRDQRAKAEARTQHARQTVIMNLHDHVARSLDSIAALALRAKLVGSDNPKLDRIREHAMHAHRALRGLFSVSDENCNTWEELRVQLREYGNTLTEHECVEFQLTDWSLDDSACELSASVKLVCFHVMSEAVANAISHGNPTTVTVEIGANADSFTLRVKDNGVGFDPSTIDKSRHHGLEIMRKRAHLIQSELHITSDRANGTQVTLAGPLAAHDNLASEPAGTA